MFLLRSPCTLEGRTARPKSIIVPVCIGTRDKPGGEHISTTPILELAVASNLGSWLMELHLKSTVSNFVSFAFAIII